MDMFSRLRGRPRKQALLSPAERAGRFGQRRKLFPVTGNGNGVGTCEMCGMSPDAACVVCR
jgi:hypothetical protein